MGYLVPGVLNGDKDSVNILPATWYQQTRDGDSGEVTTAVLENAEEWMEEIWYNGFLQFYDNRYNQLEGLSYEGSSLCVCVSVFVVIKTIVLQLSSQYG